LDDSEREERLSRLQGCGIDVESARRFGQLEMEVWENAYLRDGRFDAATMLEFIQEALGTGVRRGFPRTRLWANMEWALSEAPGVDDLASYENRLNYILPHYRDAVVCAYDLKRFSKFKLESIIRSHPYLLADGRVRQNSHYVPPQ
jgi:hypothetical protein